MSADQKVAVSKYDEVAMTLDFAREFSKQIMQIAAASEKDLKKKQKKVIFIFLKIKKKHISLRTLVHWTFFSSLFFFKQDETSKKQGETSKIREVLMIQDVLIQLSAEEVRKDFLEGTNGACKLERTELDLLDLL